MACIFIIIIGFMVTFVLPIAVLVLIIVGSTRAIKRKKNKTSGVNISESVSNERYSKVINYIIQARNSGKKDVEISSILANTGWLAEDIKKSFDFLLKK